MTIMHVAHESDWLTALETGEYRTSTRGLSIDAVGYIHASYPSQLTRVAEFVHAGDDAELCVLVIDEDLARRDGVIVRDEDGGDGDVYPHIYGPIRPAWVTEVRRARFDQHGNFRF